MAESPGTHIRRREAFRQHEEAVDEVQAADGAREGKRNPRIYLPEDAAERRADHEGEAVDRADLPESGGALLLRRDVSNVGLGDDKIRGQHAARDAGREHERERRREGRHELHDGKTEDAGEQHGFPPEAV